MMFSKIGNQVKPKFILITPILTFVFGCGQVTDGGDVGDSNNQDVQQLLRSDKRNDACNNAGIISALRDETPFTVLLMLRGVHGWLRKNPGLVTKKLLPREYYNPEAIEALGLNTFPYERANGYEDEQYFQVENLVTLKDNRDVTGAFQCEFSITVYGTNARPRSINVIYGNEPLTATRETFNLPREDMIFQGTFVTNEDVVEGYNACENDNARASQKSRCSARLLSTLEWTAIQLGSTGRVEMPSDISTWTCDSAYRDLDCATLQAAYVLDGAPVAWEWSGLYKFDDEVYERDN